MFGVILVSQNIDYRGARGVLGLEAVLFDTSLLHLWTHMLFGIAKAKWWSTHINPCTTKITKVQQAMLQWYPVKGTERCNGEI